MRKQGLVHVYFGDGKGKTTAAMGLALRAAGHGFRVVIAQFLKNGSSGECTAFGAFSGVTLLAANPSNKFSHQMTKEERQETAGTLRILLEEAFHNAREAHLLVLDEVLSAVGCGFVEEAVLIRLLQERPQPLEVIMTGHMLSQKLEEQADYISRVQKVKHPYDSGILARAGIEF